MQQDKKNSLWLGFQFVISTLFSMIGLKLNLLTFGERTFDIWLILLSVWGVGTALDLGFGVAVVRFIANLAEERKKLSEVVSTGFLTFILLGIVLYIIGNVVAELFYFSNPKLIPVEYRPKTRIVFYLLGVNFVFQYMGIFFRSVFDGLNDFIHPVKISLFYSSSLFTVIVLVYYFRASMILLALGYAIIPFIQFLVYFYLLYREYEGIKINISLFSSAVFKNMLSFSLSLQMTTIFAAFIDPIIKYITGSYFSAGFVSVYEVARRVTIAISGLFTQSFRYILPRTSILKNKEDYNIYLDSEGNKLSKFGIGYSALFFGAISFVFIIIIKYYYGYDQSIILFFVLALSESVNNTVYNLYVLLLGAGKSGYLIILQMWNVLAISVLLYIGFNTLHNSFAFLSIYLAIGSGSFLLMKFVKRETNFSIKKYFREIKIYKLFIFHSLILLNIVAIYYMIDSVLIIQIIFSIIISVIFYRELRNILFTLLSTVFPKRISA